MTRSAFYSEDQPRDDHGRWGDGSGDTKTFAGHEIQPADVYYHGTGTGGSPMQIGNPEWDNHTFITPDRAVAEHYADRHADGRVVEAHLQPDTRVFAPSLDKAEYTPEKLVGILKQAEGEGYGAVHFGGGIGTVVLDNTKLDMGNIAAPPPGTSHMTASARGARMEPTPAPPAEQADGRAPTREERERAAAAVRQMQEALAPQVDAFHETPAGADLMEAFDHFGRAADHLHHVVPGGIGIALAELTATAECLRNAAKSSTQVGIAVSPLASLAETAIASVGTWPITHAAPKGAQAFTSADARLVLTPNDGGFVLTDQGTEVARFAAEGDALEAVAGYALAEDDPNQGIPFNIFLAPEGVESGDGRLLELGTVTWRDPPLALMMQDTTSHGPGDPAPAWFAGAIDRVWRDPADESRIIGRGRLAPGEDGQRAEATIRAGMRGVSIDGLAAMPPREQITAVNQDGIPVRALTRYADTKIMGATCLPFGAFENATIWFDDEPTPERVTATHGTQIPMDAAPEVIDDGLAALVAAGGGPTKPPKAWFTAIPPDHYEPPTREGAWIHGHLGKAGTCHIGQAGTCTTIPASATRYKFFHRTTAETVEGEKIPCGWLTMNCGHERNLRASARDTIDHYDNSGTQVAKVRIVDTPNGPWMTGAIAPGLDAKTLWALEAPEVSGDWRDIDGYRRELVAVLGVPLPGFLTQRPEALVASGQIVAQIGTLPCDDCGPSPLVGNSFYDDGPYVRTMIEHAAMLHALRPQVMAAIQESVSPDAMVEAARKAAEPDPLAELRARLRV